MSFSNIFTIQTPKQFEYKALEVFNYQAKNNAVYKEFLHLLKTDVSSINKIEKIPFLPIQFFKSHKVVSNFNNIEQTFLSSGTTGSIPSKHFITDIKVYEKSFLGAFYHFFGDIKDYTILALLPSYLERGGASLVYMVDSLITKSVNKNSGFYLHNMDKLAEILKNLDKKENKILLIGVSYALLDLLEKYNFKLLNTLVLETGGMKGRRKEMIKKELHQQLKQGFGVTKIYSEYGMTELLSQAYSMGNELFKTPPWMKIIIRDTEDPFAILPHNKAGGINIIDLANYNSCSFIATQDLGKTYGANCFEILGRFDNSDIRGCNLMVL